MKDLLASLVIPRNCVSKGWKGLFKSSRDIYTEVAMSVTCRVDKEFELRILSTPCHGRKKYHRVAIGQLVFFLGVASVDQDHCFDRCRNIEVFQKPTDGCPRLQFQMKVAIVPRGVLSQVGK